jgi:hypothetical protein
MCGENVGILDFLRDSSSTERKCERCRRNFNKIDELYELCPNTLNPISLTDEIFTSNALPYAICKTCGALFCHDCFRESYYKCNRCDEVTEVVKL